MKYGFPSIFLNLCRNIFKNSLKKIWILEEGLRVDCQKFETVKSELKKVENSARHANEIRVNSLYGSFDFSIKLNKFEDQNCIMKKKNKNQVFTYR